MRDTPLGDVSCAHSVARAGERFGRRAQRARRRAPRLRARTRPSGSPTFACFARSSSRLGIAVLDAGHPAVRSASHAFLRRGLERASEIDAALPHARAGASRSRIRAAGRARARALDRVPLQRSHARRAFRSRTRRASTPTWSSRRTSCCVRWRSARSCRRSRTWEDRARSRTSRRRPRSRRCSAPSVPLVVPRWSGMVIEPHVQRLLARYSLTPEELRDPHAAESRLVRAQMPAAVRDGARALRDRRRGAQRCAPRGARGRRALAARP